MYSKLIKNISNSKIKLFIVCYLLYIFIVNRLDIFVMGSQDVIYCVNMLLNIIAIGCGVVYFKLNKNDNIFIFILIYISIFVENAYFSYSRIVGSYERLIYSIFIYRTLLLSLIIFENNKIVTRLMKKTKLTLLLSIVLNVAIIKINELHILKLSNTINDHILYLLVLIAYFVIAKAIYKVIKKGVFMEEIFLFSIILLGLKLWIVFFVRNFAFIKNLLPDDEMLFFISFSSILIALFIDNNFMSKENQILNNDVKQMTSNIEKLKEIEELRIQFFANLSHELKTPINIMYSSMQLLEMKKKMNDEEFTEVYKKYNPVFKQNCYRMIRLTNNLMDMTEINAGFLNLNFVNIDIIQLVEEITMSVVQYVENKKINIIFDTTIEEHIIKCNVDAIERIILNILSNAIKFSNVNGEILVDMSLEDDYIVIKIRDYGKGVSEEKRESIFEVFVQEDKTLSREKEGSGIGLSLVKSLVELHNGIVYLGDVDKGTEVVVKLPDVKLENEKIEDANLNSNEHSIVSKINIEFSDIYNLK